MATAPTTASGVTLRILISISVAGKVYRYRHPFNFNALRRVTTIKRIYVSFSVPFDFGRRLNYDMPMAAAPLTLSHGMIPPIP